jgi:N-acetylneuraminic acid mutarotase
LKHWGIAAILLCVAGGARAEPVWSTAAPLPLPVQEIYAAESGGRIYTIGGFGRGGQPTDHAFSYDIASDTWQSLPPLPALRHHVGVAVVGNQLYAIGGFSGTPPDWRAVAEVRILDLQSGVWRDGPPLPVARGEHVVAVVDGLIHVIGGRVPTGPDARRFAAHRDSSRVDILDPTSGIWTQGADAPTARNSAAAAVIGGRIHVVGGRRFLPNDAPRIRNVATLEIYDPARDRWVSGPDMPAAQGGLSAAAVDDRLYVFGGESFVPEPKVIAQSWVFHARDGSWSPLPDMPNPRHGTAAAAGGGALYVIGGARIAGFGAVATHERLSP